MLNESARNEVIVNLLTRVGEILIQEKYEDLDAAAPGSRVRPKDVSRVINQYGRRITGIDTTDISIIPLKDDPGWSVWANLRTEEEGKSDLVLVTRIVKIHQPPFYKIFIDDVRVP